MILEARAPNERERLPFAKLRCIDATGRSRLPCGTPETQFSGFAHESQLSQRAELLGVEQVV